MIRPVCIASLVTAMILSSTKSVSAKETWPALPYMGAKFGVETSQKRIFFQLQLRDVNGALQYTLFCEGGTTKYLDALGDKTGINYVGPFACRLVQGDKNSERSLLSEDESPYWFSRGQIHNYTEIVGACGKYPEYGELRHFRLRGFDLALHFEDIAVDKSGNPTYFALAVSVHPDPKVISERAEQTGYLTPYMEGRSCNKVLKGNEPKMCRDWKHLGGSWTECVEIKP